MNGAIEIGSAGLEAQQAALNTIASNIANINTPSFKRSDVRFSDIIATRDDPSVAAADLSPGLALVGVRAEAILALDDQGIIEPTGRAMDIAISGRGFIELMGPRGQTLLWRGGRLSIDDNGLLTGGGLPLRALIEVPPETSSIEIAADGAVSARVADGEEAIQLGQIPLVVVNEPGALERLDAGLYRVDDDALVQDAAGAYGAGEIVQGGLERSNVDLNAEMIQLMIVQRAYAANAQIVQAADQLMAIANGLRK